MALKLSARWFLVGLLSWKVLAGCSSPPLQVHICDASQDFKVGDVYVFSSLPEGDLSLLMTNLKTGDSLPVPTNLDQGTIRLRLDRGSLPGISGERPGARVKFELDGETPSHGFGCSFYVTL